MYEKCNRLDDAKAVFERIPLGKRDSASWTAMMCGFAHYGRAHEALNLFKQMQQRGVKLHDTTFIALLTACSHVGLVDEAVQAFNTITTPTILHQNCVLDVLGRAGRLKEAEEFCAKMAQPDTVTWMTLLSACRKFKDIATADHVFAKAEPLMTGQQLAALYVLMGNIYAAVGQHEKSKQIRAKMRTLGLKPIAGQTNIYVDGKVHSFVAHDKSHPLTKEIYAELDRIYCALVAVGYVQDTAWVLQDISEEEKKHSLCTHSEKLAIAFGLISTPAGTPLTLWQNLRVCGDCHTATKLIAKITGRVISVRDSSRWHEFKDGSCSCGDFF